jgi:hypothetical protein
MMTLFLPLQNLIAAKVSRDLREIVTCKIFYFDYKDEIYLFLLLNYRQRHTEKQDVAV